MPKEETPSATIRVSDYGIVLPQEIEVDIGQFTLYYDDGSKVYEWTDFGGLRPVRATIHYEYRIRGLGVEMSGYGSVENTEVAKAKVRLPYTTYPFFVETVPGDYAVQKRYYYGSRESPYVAFEVETTVKAVDVQGNPIHRGVEPEASVALRLVKQTKRYRVLVEPSPSMATQTISRQGKKPKFDDRPPAVEYKAAGRVVWPSLRNSKIRDDTESALFTRERVERDQERRLTGVASNKVIEIEVEKPVRAHVMVSYQPSGGEWKHVLNLVERTKGVYMDALEDEVEYVNVQVRVYPIDTIGVVALRGLRVEVHQSALVGYGYTTERLALVGEY
ncbi:MAG: hypothetical protein NZ941_08185, partial [Candidatus Caldarchaeum sp.]|nr:hypothetical protein [Candidatus Caldarchaeum sp.]